MLSSLNIGACNISPPLINYILSIHVYRFHLQYNNLPMVLVSRVQVVHLFRAIPRQLTPVYCARHSQFQSGLTASLNQFIHNANNKYMIISYINLEIEYYRNYYHDYSYTNNLSIYPMILIDIE